VTRTVGSSAASNGIAATMPRLPSDSSTSVPTGYGATSFSNALVDNTPPE
jgi:hypothetical protein